GMIDLGDAEEIDTAVAKSKKEISTMEKKAIKSSREIYNLVFEPLRNELGDVKEIFISPDGNLNLIPFEVLRGPDGRYLIEDYTFNYLAAGRDVLGFGQIKGEGKKALLMGDPDFDIDHKKRKLTLRKMALMDGDQEKVTRRSADMRGFHFTRLPGAREEVKAIQKILGSSIESEIYLDSEALEEVLKQKSAPRILHLATHGFFLNNQELARIPADPTGRGFYSFTMPIREKGRMARIENQNPMLRSGFVLAGANRSTDVMDQEADDGIVTSEEILGLQLRGTDMVVLSACDTGLGDVKTGEGVFGLRHAFAQAGAKSLIMSLWAIPDKETRELMVEFYKNIMSGQMNRSQALRQAALKEMKIVKKRYGHANPFFWGGFVMVGDPG
ncbi:MAG: CHAT domain-containing protein, partial [Desulfobacterales bacterium]|nr:CHAT domain-containing protein [Desulfobacterales bacterium]